MDYIYSGLLLIGATHFYDLLRERKIKPVVNGAVFQETGFGWIVSGLISTSDCENNLIINTHHATINDDGVILENTLPLFWRIEEYGSNNPYTIEEKTRKKHFDNTITRGADDDGRFIVQLPFHSNAVF